MTALPIFELPAFIACSKMIIPQIGRNVNGRGQILCLQPQPIHNLGEKCEKTLNKLLIFFDVSVILCYVFPISAFSDG